MSIGSLIRYDETSDYFPGFGNRNLYSCVIVSDETLEKFGEQALAEQLRQGEIAHLEKRIKYLMDRFHVLILTWKSREPNWVDEDGQIFVKRFGEPIYEAWFRYPIDIAQGTFSS